MTTKPPSWHYFEAHVELDGDNFLADIVKELKFYSSALDDDTEDAKFILTSRSTSFHDLKTRMRRLVLVLHADGGVRVLRYKIESTVLDSRYDDELRLLGKTVLPED